MNNPRDKMTQAEYRALFGSPKVAGTERVESAGKARQRTPKRVSLGLGDEHSEQVALFEWAETVQGQIPELALLFAIPNGAKLPYTRNKAGKVSSKQRISLVAEGLKAGVPDVFLPVPVYIDSEGTGYFYSGLFIEMKIPPNKPSDAQEWWIKELTAKGYKAVVCYGGWQEAKEIILQYLER